MAFRNSWRGPVFLVGAPVMHGVIRFRQGSAARGDRRLCALCSGVPDCSHCLQRATGLAPDGAPVIIGLLWIYPYLIQVYRFTKIRASVSDYIDACAEVAQAPGPRAWGIDSARDRRLGISDVVDGRHRLAGPSRARGDRLPR